MLLSNLMALYARTCELMHGHFIRAVEGQSVKSKFRGTVKLVFQRGRPGGSLA